MNNYMLRRIAVAIPVLFFVSVLTFLIVTMAPGDPVDLYVSPDATEAQLEATREVLGLNDPLPIQYGKWLANVLQGNLGFSYSTRQSVADIIAAKVGPTLLLMGTTLIVAYVIAIPLGILCARKKNTWIDNLLTGGSFVGISTPNFFLGLGLIYLFSLQLKWLPSGGMMVLGGDGGIWERVKHLILPVAVLATSYAANMIRYVRASMIEVFGENYMRTATAKGLTQSIILNRHAVRNALIPIITVIGSDIPKLVGGAVVTEQIFQWPGLGQLMITSINARDYPVLMALTMFSAVAVLFANVIVDFLYAAVDPRIKFD